MLKPSLDYERRVKSTIAIGLLKFYGFLSRPFNFHWLAWIGVFVGKHINVDVVCTVALMEDSRYRFHLADYYWSKLVCQGFVYEPEIDRVLRTIASRDFIFLDLGANHGYWSVVASSRDFGDKRVVAIEPVKRNFDMLSANNRLNGNRFTAIRSAVTQNFGAQVQIHTNPASLANEGASLLANQASSSTATESVQSVSVDQLVAQFADSNQAVVIKLDVEGMEVEAIKGAVDTLNRDVLLIFEDHGNDPDCKVSEYVLSLGLAVFHLERGRYSKINSLDDVKSMKTRTNKGYNLFAHKQFSEFSGLFEDAFTSS